MNLALFDFDNTLTTKDTLFQFILHTHGRIRFLFGIISLFPILILFKLKITSAQKTKEKLLSYFYHGKNHQYLIDEGIRFNEKILPNILNNKLIEKMLYHKKQNDKVIVVSASIDYWVKPFCDLYNIDLISTNLQFEDGVFNGKIDGENCNGLEKVKRIKEYIDISNFKEIYAYGDSDGDIPMLNLASHPYRLS